MSKIKIGILGCANVALNHIIPAIQELPELFEFIGVASRSEEKAKHFSDIFKCNYYVGYKKMLEDTNIDALYVPLPTGLHKEWINKALISGKHVYAEKSIAMTIADAKTMIDNACHRNLALMEGYMFQYHDQHNIVKDLLRKKEIGEIRHITASFGFPPLKDSSNFRYDANLGGGALYDVGGYVWRAINFLMGNVFEIKKSNIYYNQKGTSIFGSAFAIASGDISATISFGFDNFYQCRYEVWGSLGKITCPKAFTPKEDESTVIILEKHNVEHKIECKPCNHFVKALEVFYNACFNENMRRQQYNDIKHQIAGLEYMQH